MGRLASLGQSAGEASYGDDEFDDDFEDPEDEEEA